MMGQSVLRHRESLRSVFSALVVAGGLLASSGAEADQDLPPTHAPHSQTASLNVESGEQRAQPIPLRILALDISGSGQDRAVRFAAGVLTSDEAGRVFDESGPQIVAMIVWAKDAQVLGNTYYIVNNGEEARQLFARELGNLAVGRDDIHIQTDGTEPSTIFPLVRGLIRSVQLDGYSVSVSSKVLLIGDGFGYGPYGLIPEVQALARENCTETHAIIFSDSMRDSNRVGQALESASYRSGKRDQRIACHDPDFPQFPIRIDKNTTHYGVYEGRPALLYQFLPGLS